MTDRELFIALRLIDSPASPRGQFQEELYAKLTATAGLARRRTARPHGGMPFVLGRGTFRFAAAAVALLVAVIAFGVWSNLPTVGPAFSPSPSPTATESPTETPIPSDAVGSGGVVAYTVCSPDPDRPWNCAAYQRLWLANVDGTGAHELLPDELGHQRPLAWSADGSQLYYYFEWGGLGPADGGHGLALTDAAGSTPRVLFDAGSPSTATLAWCPEPVEDDNCGRSEGLGALSPDSTRLAYAVVEGADLNISTIVVLDIATGDVTWLESTRSQNPGLRPNEGPLKPCTSDHGGYNGSPQWSPDGTALVFTRLGCRNAIFTVNANDTDLRELALLDGEWDGSVLPRWSPDGSSIVFAAKTYPPGFPDVPDAPTVDVYTVRPDGTGTQALTRDGLSILPFWTRDGRIVFIRLTAIDGGRGDLWIMDADGAHATQLQATVPALTAAGCLVCPYPIGPDPDPGNPNQFFPPWEPGFNQRLWQPVMEDQQ